MNDNDTWLWYYSSDEETWYGPYIDEANAIAAGLAASYGGKYHVAECHQGLLYMAIFDDLAERIEDLNEDLHGDHEVLTDQITQTQWGDLQRELNRVATNWCKRHNCRQFMFDGMRSETVHGGESND